MSLRHEDPDIRSRLIKLDMKGKGAITPRRSLCLTLDPNSEAKVLKSNDNITGINELPREITKSKLEDIDNDRDKQESFYRDLRYRFSGIDTSTHISAFIFSYNNKENGERNRQPKTVETEYLCALLNHPFNDIWVPPIVPQLSGRAYIPYLKDFFEQAASYRGILRAGLIPHIARLEIRLLRDAYLRYGLNYFVMDFAGKNPLDLIGNINEVLSLVDYIERESGVTCFLHGVNVPLTKAHWKTPVVPAKDILLFGLGFGCFGSSHIRRQLPDEMAEKMKSTTKRPFRLFNRGDYGYYRDDTTGLREMLREDEKTDVSLDDFGGILTWSKVSQMEKLFNVERHGLEASTLRSRLIEKESIAKYVQTKSRIPDGYLKKILNVGKRQATLD